MTNNYDNLTLNKVNLMVESVLRDSLKHLKDVEFRDHLEAIETMGRVKVLYEIEIEILKMLQHEEPYIREDLIKAVK